MRKVKNKQYHKVKKSREFLRARQSSSFFILVLCFVSFSGAGIHFFASQLGRGDWGGGVYIPRSNFFFFFLFFSDSCFHERGVSEHT